MTMSNIMPNGFLLPVATQATTQASSSQQGWLRELERAQAGLLGQQQDSAQAKPQARRAESVPQLAEADSVLHREAPLASTLAARWVGPQTAATDTQRTPSMMAGQVADAVHIQSQSNAGGIAVGIFRRDLEIPDSIEAPVTSSEDVLPGRDEHDCAKTSFKLLSAGDDVVDAAIRDPEMTLESELRLTQHIRTAVQATGSKLGKVWLNGRTVMNNSQGERNGD